MGDISVKPLGPAEYSEWDHFVGGAQQGTIFHRSFWASALADALNLKYSIRGCFSDDKIIGGYILYQPRSNGLLKAGHSTQAMSNFGGLITNSEEIPHLRKREETINTVVNAVTASLQDDELDYIRFELSPPFSDIRPFIWNKWGHTICYTYTIPPGMATPSRAARRHIRHAEENGIVIEPSTDIDTYYALFAETYQRQSLPPPLTREQMKRIYGAIRASDSGEMWIARMPSGEWAAAEIQLYDEKRSYAWSAASDGALRTNGAKFLLRKTVLDYEARKEIQESYLFTANIPNLANFTVQFGPKLYPYFQVWKRQGRLNLFKMLRAS